VVVIEARPAFPHPRPVVWEVLSLPNLKSLRVRSLMYHQRSLRGLKSCIKEVPAEAEARCTSAVLEGKAGLEEVAAMEEFEDPTATATVTGRGSRVVTGVEAQDQRLNFEENHP